VFVESPLIHHFVQSLEQGPAVSGVQPLIGGQAVEQVAVEQHTEEFQFPHV
jgi:hypothetical protein